MTVTIPASALEQVEAETFADYEAAAPAEAQVALGTRLLRVGGGVALAMPNDPTGFWSKLIGLGFEEPITAKLLEPVFEFYREQGMSSVTLQFAPQALPPNWADICTRLNIADAGSALVKQAGDLETITSTVGANGGVAAYLDAGLRLEEVGADRAHEWARVMWGVFGFPFEHQSEMGIGAIGRPGWQSFAVIEDEEIVAVACLHTAGRYGHLFGAATEARVRGRGAQSALIAARALAAREADCEWLIAETAAEGPGEHNTSLHNMARAGMPVRYERKNWTWQAPAK